MPKSKRKKQPWQDKEYMKQMVLQEAGMPIERIPPRFMKLLLDIQSVAIRTDFYYFPEARHRSIELKYAFINELRKGILNDG